MPPPMIAKSKLSCMMLKNYMGVPFYQYGVANAKGFVV